MIKDPRTGPRGATDLSQADPVEGIILVNLALQSVAIDRGGRIILWEFGEAGPGDSPLPELPAEIAKPLRAASPAELQSKTLRVSAGETHYSCRVFLMLPQNSAMAEPLLAIHLRKERSVGESVRRASRTYHLTEREQEALLGIASGLTSRQLALKMNISPNTVNAFLRLIMVKMGVTTRAGIVGKLINGRGGRMDAHADGAAASQR